MSDTGDAGSRFRVLYESHYPEISAFALRRLGSPHEVGDVVAEVFTVAWRRFDKIPDPPQDRLWLYGVARRVIGTQRRSTMRRGSLVARLVAQPAPAAPPGVAVEDPIHDHVRAVIEDLRPPDREALLLVLWEGLSHADAAQVLGCSVNAVAIRVHRAKIRVRDVLTPTGHQSEFSVSALPTPKVRKELHDGS